LISTPGLAVEAGIFRGIKKMTKVTIKDIDEQIIEEIDRDMPRIHLITRLLGKRNRLKGRHLHQSILQLIGKPGAKKTVSAILGDNR
jgi:hypothetical protein